MQTRNFYSVILIAIAALLVGNSSVQASYTLGSDYTDVSPLPPSQIGGGPSTYQSDTKIYFFKENQGVTTNGTEIGDSEFGGTLPAGKVNSFFAYWDPSQDTGSGFLDQTFGSATITFTEDILAVYNVDNDLDTTDAQFGLIGTTYTDEEYRGARRNDTASNNEEYDTFSWSGKTLTITQLRAGTPGYDSLRIITRVPEPTSLMMFGLAMVGFARRRK